MWKACIGSLIGRENVGKGVSEESAKHGGGGASFACERDDLWSWFWRCRFRTVLYN